MGAESSPPVPPRAWVEVDLGAVVRNAEALSRHARAPLIPMVKADAYGLGAVPVARALERLEPSAFGVSSIAEGEELRAAGIGRPILCFTPVRPDDLPRLRAAGMTPTLSTTETIAAWGRDGGAWHLAIDTGMHRAGANWDQLDALRDALVAYPPAGAFTHFYSAEADDGSLERQEERFRAALARLPERPAVVHAENSAAIVRRGPSAWDVVRPGIFLYGVGSGAGAALQPAPVAALHARVLELRDIAPGESVSYGATWRARTPRRIATVACGYADGLRRALGNAATALCAGHPVPLVGVVTMDMAMLDVTDVACALGDPITFLGRSGDAWRTAEGVAASAGLSPYELLTGLRLRLPRIYRGG
ncbi:MAG: alanine racemase [Gemmatimonadota bacterium]|nr:alanine racemase [Gemmatimonadota bacterium]MDQ8177392.1 alanine racemase [Gemmatimonadota bacterium]